MKVRFFSLCACLLLLIPVTTAAHRDDASFETLSEKHLIDIGYDLPFQVGQETLLDFALFALAKDEAGSLASFTNVTVKLHSGATVMYQRSVDKPEFGKAFVTLTPDTAGHWSLSADFFMKDTLVDSASFDLVIKESLTPPPQEKQSIGLILVISLLLAASAVVAFKKIWHS